MQSGVRSIWVIKFPDGSYAGTHRSPAKRAGREWYAHGRRVPFEKARIFHTKAGAIGSKKFMPNETIEIVQVLISEPVMVPKKELEYA